MWWLGLFAAIAALLNLTCQTGKISFQSGIFWFAFFVVGLGAMWVGQ